MQVKSSQCKCNPMKFNGKWQCTFENDTLGQKRMTQNIHNGKVEWLQNKYIFCSKNRYFSLYEISICCFVKINRQWHHLESEVSQGVEEDEGSRLAMSTFFLTNWTVDLGQFWVSFFILFDQFEGFLWQWLELTPFYSESSVWGGGDSFFSLWPICFLFLC